MTYLKIVLIIFLFFCLSYPVVAQYELPAVGDIYQNFFVDLDGDTIEEEIQVKVFSSSEDMGWFGQIVVLDYNGSVIWEGPKDEDMGNPLVFCSTHGGVSLPEVIGDIDYDGYIEIVSPAPISDVSAPFFRVLRYEGKGFFVLRESVLVEVPEESEFFPWSDYDDSSGMGTWVSEFQDLYEDGTCLVYIVSISDDDFRGGRAIVVNDLEGFHILEWIDPLKSLY